MSKISLILQTVFFIFIYGKAYACIPAPDHEQREKERIERLFEDTNYIVKAVIANMEKFETSVKEYILSQDEISKILTKASKIVDSSAQRELEATASLDKGSKDRVEKLLVKRDELKETEKKLLQSSFTFTAHQWLRGKGYNNIKLLIFKPCFLSIGNLNTINSLLFA